MNYPNDTTPALSVRDDGTTTASGARVPAAEARATAIAEQAGRWLAFATERSQMTPETLTAKALASVAFSVHRGASSFAVPSKLSGTSKYQRALWALVRDPAEPWAVLDLDAGDSGLTASHDGEPLGAVQPKHVPWLRPLVPFGLTAHLGRVTGHEHERYTLGVNVCFGHVGLALDRLLDALGHGRGDGAPSGSLRADGVSVEPGVSSGDGAPHGAAPALSQAPRSPGRGGVPTSPLRLVVRPEHDAVRPGADRADVVLYRRLDGTACASVDHVARHSPSGVEWGYPGAGPADLALSVLTAVVGPEAAERHHHAFKAEVVARVPYAGGVIRAADVRAWAAAHDADR